MLKEILRRKVIPDGNFNVHKGVKSTENIEDPSAF